MTEAWQAKETDLYQGQSAYILYVAGVAVLNNPAETFPLHRLDTGVVDYKERLLIYAQTLIWTGLTDVIRFANRPEHRYPIQAAEAHFEEALPNMRRIINTTYETESERMTTLNNMLPVIRPLPVSYESTYKAIAHSRKRKVKMHHIMGGFALDPKFDRSDYERTFSGTPVLRKGARSQLRVVNDRY